MRDRANSILPAIAAIFSFFWVSAAAAAETAPAAPTDRMLQQELKQQQIKTTTQRVSEQLTAIISEFERNAIGGEDVKVLRAIRSVLGRLSEKDMQKVIGLLQEARSAENPSAATQRATDAYAGQRSIITQLNQLVLEYQRQQALYELSLRFKEYAKRQTANMWLGADLGRETEGKTLGAFTEPQQSSLRIQQIDQENLRDEVQATVGKLEKMTKEITDGTTAERSKLALQQAQQGGLKPALDGSVDDLRVGKMLSAAGNEKKARDQLREIARLLILSQGETEALRQALHELEKTIDQQKSVMDDTRKIDKDDTAKVQPRQAEVVDATDLIRRDVNSLAPVAGEHLKEATDKMQEARSALSTEKDPQQQREKVPPKQQEALANLEQARRDLQDQLAKAEEKANQPENALAAMKELQDKLRNLAKQQENLKGETAAAQKKDLPGKAPKQGELKDAAQELQPKAASQAPQAAQSIGEAAAQMQKSQNALANAQNSPAAQQAAIDALQRADQQLGQEIAKLEQAQQDLARMEELQKQLQAVIEEQHRVQFGTAREAVKNQSPPLNELSSRQGKLGNDTGQLQQEASTAAPTAAGHLGDAKGHMNEAKTELDKPAPKTAQPKQTEALADLYDAKRDIDSKMNDLREMLGMGPMDNAQSLADAASLIEKAQRDVNQAMSQMQQSPPGLMDMLLQQQKQIAGSLGEMGQSASAPPPVKQAQQAADQAAQQLAQSNLPKAIDSMKAAESAMQQQMQSGQQQPPQQTGQQTQNQTGRQQQQPPPAQGEASMPQLSQQQKEVRQTAESLLQALQSAPASAMQQAAKSLESAGSTILPLTAGKMGPLPQSAQSALQSAQGSLANGSAEAAAGQGPPAQADAASAAQSLAQAQAALALAQAGLGSESAMANQQGKGQKPGQGQGKGQGQKPGQGQGQGTPNSQGTGRQGNWAGPGGADGTHKDTVGPGQYTALPKRDRAAIMQSQSEKYPQEYGPLVEQYLKNLSDQSGEPNK